MGFSIRAGITPFEWAEEPGAGDGWYWARRKYGDDLGPPEPVMVRSQGFPADGFDPREVSFVPDGLSPDGPAKVRAFLWGPPIAPPVVAKELGDG
jgi:hypothetical protein